MAFTTARCSDVPLRGYQLPSVPLPSFPPPGTVPPSVPRQGYKLGAPIEEAIDICTDARDQHITKILHRNPVVLCVTTYNTSTGGEVTSVIGTHGELIKDANVKNSAACFASTGDALIVWQQATRDKFVATIVTYQPDSTTWQVYKRLDLLYQNIVTRYGLSHDYDVLHTGDIVHADFAHNTLTFVYEIGLAYSITVQDSSYLETNILPCQIQYHRLPSRMRSFLIHQSQELPKPLEAVRCYFARWHDTERLLISNTPDWQHYVTYDETEAQLTLRDDRDKFIASINKLVLSKAIHGFKIRGKIEGHYTAYTEHLLYISCDCRKVLVRLSPQCYILYQLNDGNNYDVPSFSDNPDSEINVVCPGNSSPPPAPTKEDLVNMGLWLRRAKSRRDNKYTPGAPVMLAVGAAVGCAFTCYYAWKRG